jgi:lipoprotein-anchoring transpeptidase ErfK/SrfK
VKESVSIADKTLAHPSKSAKIFGNCLLGGAIIVLSVVAGRHALPFGIEMPSFIQGDGNTSVDPYAEIAVSGIGLGTRLRHAELADESGHILAEVNHQTHFRPTVGLEFGRRYQIKVDAERLWLGQQKTRVAQFTTVTHPRIESPLRQELGPDGTISLKFSEPVGQISTTGDLPLQIQPDSNTSGFKLMATQGSYIQGRTYEIAVDWKTFTGVPLAPFKLEISTAPPLKAQVMTSGMTNLGLAMPVQIDFSEPLGGRENASRAISIRTAEGDEIGGKWRWYGKQRLQFTPQPGWPASSKITVSLDPAGLKTARGGFLSGPVNASFSTGSDRRIEVYLDRQRVEVFENGEIIKTLKASTGKSKTPTVTGNFYIYARFPTKTMKSTGLKPGEKGYYEVKDVPYAQYFHEGYAFHGAFWHNNFGRPASHGCINLATRKKNERQGVNEDAGWLYQWASLGVPVIVHRTSRTDDKVAATE